jgi:hypothetical protein
MITKIFEPSGVVSVQDDLWHVVASDSSGTTDFKYIFDVYRGDQQLARVKQFPEPSTGKAYYNPAKIVQGQITYEWFVPENKIYLRSPNSSGEMSVQYRVEYGEEVSGVQTFNMASGQVRAYNFRPPLFKRRINGLADKNNKFVTNRPLMAKSKVGEKLLVGVHSPTGVAAIITKYGYNGLSLGSDNNSFATSYEDYCQLNISPDGINGSVPGFITSAVAYYTVHIDELGNPPQFRVDIACDGEYTSIPLHFMNQYGMFDTARFALVSLLTADVERKSFKLPDYRLTNSGVTYYNTDVYHETKVNYNQKIEHSYKLTLESPTDQEYQWLYELIVSPQIYAEIDGYFYPVTIKNTNYEYSTYLNNRLRPLEIDIELNQTRYSHAR